MAVIDNGPTIPAVSLYQPWATAMALKIKKNETRHWPTDIRGWLAIHAAKRPVDREGRLLATAAGLNGLLVFGCFVCIVRIVGCEKTELLKRLGVSDQEQGWGNYADGRWAWVTSPNDLIEIPKPIPFIGHQGIFRWVPPAWLQDRMRENKRS
jgi:hypothetical protein